MGAFGVALVTESVRAGLEPGEVALGYESASMLTAADRSGRARVKPRAVEGFSFDPVAGGFQAEEDYFDATLTGIGAEGAAGAWGQRVMAALNGDGHSLLLTDRRLAVVGGMPPVILFSVPREEVVGLRPVPRLLQAGRIEIAFRDGSVVRPMLAMVLPRAPRRFRRAWETGTPQS